MHTVYEVAQRGSQEDVNASEYLLHLSWRVEALLDRRRAD